MFRQIVAALGLLGLALSSFGAASTRTIDAREIIWRTTGVGSIPGVLLRDGTVCTTETNSSFQCKPLGALSPKLAAALGNGDGTFDGIFDLEDAGSPQIFIEYWAETVEADCNGQNPPERCDDTVLLIYRKVGNVYVEQMKVFAPTLGYAGGAWFLDESPRKAVFRTRCGGSSGPCLFYLDVKTRALKPITGDLYLEGEPEFEDIDGDGVNEIFVPGRGRDRTSSQGAAVFRWTGNMYKIWWPQWSSKTYVIWAELHDLHDDPHKEIVAVLDPQGESSRRQLGIWRLAGAKWKLRTMVALPNNNSTGDAEFGIAFPTIASVEGDRGGTIIKLGYGDLFAPIQCRFESGRLSCPRLLESIP